ncbi:MAG: FAD:protein FMN transferase [Clostridia bacterium]
MKKIILFLTIIILFLSGCARNTHETVFAMDTVMDLTLNDGDVIDTLTGEIARLENIFSPTRDDSEVSRINAHGGADVLSPDMQNALKKSMGYAAETGGAFDPTLDPLVKLWSHEAVPKRADIADALVKCGYLNIKYDGTRLTLPRGGGLNLGGIAKGYTSDVLKKVLVDNSIKSAILSLGGNVVAHGSRSDGTPWVVGVADPDGGANATLGTLRVSDKFVIASGDYERYFMQDGRRYHHIIDAHSGAPSTSDLREAVIVCEDGAMGDAYSTALFVMGSTRAIEFWRAHNNFEMILVTKNHKVIVSKGLLDSFTLDNGGYSYETCAR